MNQWSRTRKRIILGIVLFVLTALIGLPLYLFLYHAPTCFDDIMNGDEAGIDCGGSCGLLCTTESLPIISRGDPRVLTIAPGVFEVVALVENPNPQAGIVNARYSVKLYNSSGTVPIKTIEGATFVPKATSFAIFEGPFNLEVVPTRAIIEWDTSTLLWQKDNSPEPELMVKNQTLSRADSNPRVEVLVENLSLQNVSNVDLVALIYDENSNIFAASKTFIDTLPAGGEKSAVFTWPRPFGSLAAEIEIIVRIFPDRSFLR